MRRDPAAPGECRTPCARCRGAVTRPAAEGTPRGFVLCTDLKKAVSGPGALRADCTDREARLQTSSAVPSEDACPARTVRQRAAVTGVAAPVYCGRERACWRDAAPGAKRAAPQRCRGHLLCLRTLTSSRPRGCSDSRRYKQRSPALRGRL